MADAPSGALAGLAGAARRARRAGSGAAGRAHPARHRRRLGRGHANRVSRRCRWPRSRPTTTTRSAPNPNTPNRWPTSLDGDPNTTWSTEHYLDGTLGSKPGTGVYIDAAPGLQARALEVQTPTPGFAAAVYARQPLRRLAALRIRARASPNAAGCSSPPPQAIAGQSTIHIDTGGARYRYYLLWITSLPPGSETAAISEITLFK